MVTTASTLQGFSISTLPPRPAFPVSVLRIFCLQICGVAGEGAEGCCDASCPDVFFCPVGHLHGGFYPDDVIGVVVLDHAPPGPGSPCRS